MRMRTRWTKRATPAAACWIHPALEDQASISAKACRNSMMLCFTAMGATTQLLSRSSAEVAEKHITGCVKCASQGNS